MKIIAGKTATLFELPCRLGARLAGAPDQIVTALSRYGHHLGIAFQLADDALDVWGSAERLGKYPLSDVREGVYTLSVLRLLAQARRPRIGYGNWSGRSTPVPHNWPRCATCCSARVWWTRSSVRPANSPHGPGAT